MLRALIQIKHKSQLNGAEYAIPRTIDFDAPELEEALTRGGLSESGYEIPELIDIEVLPPKPTPKD